MIFNFRKHEESIERKEAEIKRLKQQFHKKVDNDLRSLSKINKVLANGITLKIYEVTHGDTHAK